MNEDIQLISSLPEDKKEELTLESPFQAGIVEQQSHNEIKIE